MNNTILHAYAVPYVSSSSGIYFKINIKLPLENYFAKSSLSKKNAVCTLGRNNS